MNSVKIISKTCDTDIIDITEARVRDKRMLMDEVIDLKKIIAKNEGEISYKDSQLLDARNELDKSATALKNAETKIITLKSQVRCMCKPCFYREINVLYIKSFL